MTASYIRAWNEHPNFLISPFYPTRSGAMPSVAQESPPVPSAKKRRRDDDGTTTTTDNNTSNLQLPLSPSPLHNHNHISRTLYEDGAPLHYHHVPAALRKTMPLPMVKRIRTLDDKDDTARPISNPSPAAQPHAKTNSQISREESRERSSHDRPTPTSNLAPSSLMSRCHICSRKPTRKSDLDSFADCEGCGQRTCFICIRQCLDWRPHNLRDQNTDCDRQKGRVSLGAMSTDSFTMEDATESTDDQGRQEPGQNSLPKHEQAGDSEGWAAKGGHRLMVCSKCCVETGKHGDVVCLGCLRFVEG